MNTSQDSVHPFSSEGVYPCPVCHWGQISALPLMDALACNFCNHIFTANVERQVLKMADREPAMSWRWNGRSWRGAHLEGVEFGCFYWGAAMALIILPPLLIGLTAYTFPPVPGTRLSWLPVVWTGLAFIAHLFLVGWLVLEFYQFPVTAYLRALYRRILSR
ncbi:MAG: hypothetical protein ACM37W_11050 [Actinomycetota bacterium]